jgi:hypothetical protein
MSRPLPPSDTANPRRALVVVALVILVACALWLRTWRLDQLPLGLHFDEAGNGLLIQDHIFRGETPVFFSAYAGREALFMYTQAPFLALLGRTTVALRLPSALWSTVLVLVLYGLGTRMWGWRQGLMAALAAACGGWLVHVGRIGFRANTLPVLSALAVWCLYRALMATDARRARRDWLLSGALFGLCLYTYLAVRVLPLLAPLLLGYLLVAHRPTLRRHLGGIAWFALALAVVATPFVVHMVRVPSDFFARIGQIGAQGEAGAAQTALAQTWATLKMFGVRGARDGFFNLPFRPVFPGIAALPFYLGVIVAALRWRELRGVLVLLWGAVMLLPTILAADAPHWLRAVGAAPATYLLWGLGAGSAWAWLGQRWRYGTATGWLFAIVAAGWWTQATAHEYFDVWARRPEIYYDYMQYASDAAQEAERTPAEHSLLVSEDYYRHATYLFLSPRTHSAQWFDARHAVVWPRTAPWKAVVSASTPTTGDIDPLLRDARGEPYAPNGLYAYTKLEGDSVPPFEPPQPADARFGDVLELRGTGYSGALAAGQTLHVQLWARATGSPGRELRIFVHLVDEQGRIVTQQDALGYDAREWQPGDQFISFHDLALPPKLPAGRLRLVAGLYDVVDGTRYPASGTGAQGDYVELAPPGEATP